MARITPTTVKAENGHRIPMADGKLPRSPATRKASLTDWLSHPFFRFLGLTFIPIVLATFAFAHAVLVESSPAPNSTVNGPNVEITLKFNVRIDVARSRLQLMLPGGASRSLPVREGNASNIMLGQAADLTPGKYKLIWQVLASDGHITRGETFFSVK